MWEMCWILILCSSLCVRTGLKHIPGGVEGCCLKLTRNQPAQTPCSSRWPSAFLALTGTPWDKDVHCHGDHIQENAGKEGHRRCNTQKYRFGPGERLFSTCASFFFFLYVYIALTPLVKEIVACHSVFCSCFMTPHYSCFFNFNLSLNLNFGFPWVKFVGNSIRVALLNVRK